MFLTILGLVIICISTEDKIKKIAKSTYGKIGISIVFIFAFILFIFILISL